MSARATDKFGHVGQNVYLQKISKKVPGIPFKGVKKWFAEIKKFDAQQINPFAFTYKTGHFTQIVWATTTEVSDEHKIYLCLCLRYLSSFVGWLWMVQFHGWIKVEKNSCLQLWIWR